jgi:hypothetical protein
MGIQDVGLAIGGPKQHQVTRKIAKGTYLSLR